MELKVGGGRFKLIKKLGNGAFGDIYMGQDVRTNENVGIKLELLNKNWNLLNYEAKIYSFFDGGQGMPKLHYFGAEGDYNVMVMELLGPSLEAMFEFCNRNFSLKTIMMVAIQLIQRIEFIHSRTFIHRDIKPENFLVGTGKKQDIIYAIDFGLAKRYIDPKTGGHIAFKLNRGLTGTARFASLNAQMGNEQSRKDDLESIGFIIIYFLKEGHLPWMGLKGKNQKEHSQKILEYK